MTAARTASPPAGGTDTVQLLVDDAGNRSAIGTMLDDRFDVETSETVTDADLYLVEDALFAEYQDALGERIDDEHPAFCPVVLIRREGTTLSREDRDLTSGDEGVRIDEVVDAPIDPSLLLRRLNSLLVRRRQSRELLGQVATLEERERRLRRFEHGVESTGSGLVMTDPSGEIEYVNPALEAISGYAEADVIGASAQVLLPDGAADVFDEEFWGTMRDREAWDGDIVIERKDGSRRVVDATVSALRDPEQDTEGFVIGLSDITERIQREQDLEDRREELDLLRQILTRYLRHNLRNDLNLVLGNAQLLADEELSPTNAEAAATITRTANQLIEKSDTARTYSMLLERESPLSPFDLATITRNAVETVRAAYPDVAIEVDVPETCEIRAREGIQRAFEELIGNAARHNDAPDPWVRVQVRESDGARLVIEDNGPGIPDQEMATLERETETQLSHSQGIGLWLGKWVIEGIDGRLSIEPTDPGTRVTVDLPPPERVGSEGLDVTKLKERERRLQTVTDRMTDAVVQVDADWTVTVLDGRAERIFGLDADAALENELWDVVPALRNTRFETVVRDAMETRASTSVEEQFPAIDAWLEINVYPEFDGGLSLYARDVTERNERETQLRRYEYAFESSLSGIAITSLDGVLTDVNPAVLDMWGYDERDEVLGRPVTEFWKDPEEAATILEEITERGSWEGEYEGVRADGSTFYTRSSASLIRDEDGEPIAVMGSFVDITERKERELRYEAIFNRTFQFTGLLEPDGTILESNDTALEFAGIARADVLGEKFWDAPWFDVSDATRRRMKADVERAASGEFVRHELEVQGADERLTIDFSLRPITDDDGSVVLLVPEARDISELKERERDLETTRKRYRALVAATPDPVFVVDAETGETIETNEAAESLLGEPRERILGRQQREFHPPEDADLYREAFETLDGRETVRTLPDGSRPELVTGEGERVPIEISANTVSLPDGPVKYAIVRDVSERVERERELMAATEFLSTLFETIPAGVVVLDADGTITRANSHAEEQLGLDRSEITDRTYSDPEWHIYGEDGDPVEPGDLPFGRVMATGEPVTGYEHGIERSDGSRRWLSINAAPITAANGEVETVVTVISDVTELREHRKRLDADGDGGS